jgi:hypothetical protein
MTVQARLAEAVDLDELAERAGAPREAVDWLVEQLAGGELIVIRDESGRRPQAVLLGADHPLLRALPGWPGGN